jgi:tRNA C32,U32 (ribose-2'-O)-methylase TrmJ
LKWYEVRLQQNRVDIEAARQQGAADKKAKNAISQRLDGCLTKWQAVVHTKDTKTYSTMRTLFAEQTQEYEDLAEAEYAYVT